jgi:hypothetical protein
MTNVRAVLAYLDKCFATIDGMTVDPHVRSYVENRLQPLAHQCLIFDQQDSY